RRHTISDRDWSSDVCSSDLYNIGIDYTVLTVSIDPREDSALAAMKKSAYVKSFIDSPGREGAAPHLENGWHFLVGSITDKDPNRSEERRVGKESRSRWWR